MTKTSSKSKRIPHSPLGSPFERFVDDAVNYALNAPYPDTDEVARHVFA